MVVSSKPHCTQKRLVMDVHPEGVPEKDHVLRVSNATKGDVHTGPGRRVKTVEVMGMMDDDARRSLRWWRGRWVRRDVRCLLISSLLVPVGATN